LERHGKHKIYLKKKCMKTGILLICMLLFLGLEIYSIDIYVAPGQGGKELGTARYSFC